MPGNWVFMGCLGQGGFGEVNHWRNQKTNQEIASKHIKDEMKSKISVDQQNKLKDRWKQEFEWSRKFNKSFFVSGVKLGADSEEFILYLNKKHIWNLPVIILEYCNGGDVRQLLEKPHNWNGLLEIEVREIMRTLRLAIDFLHNTCKICHRDLKPDNIVIHRMANGKKLYKLTDFGLARNTPENTIQQSIVGTRHYCAPEVVDTGKYKHTIDYWSMGVIIYQLVTGVLPFIPHQIVFNIHVNIEKKHRDCIAITEDYNNQNRFLFHNQFPVGHHLSQPLIIPIINWLRVALDSNYSTRGNLPAPNEVQKDNKVPDIFTMVDRILEIKVLTIFADTIFKRLEYAVTDKMTMEELVKQIHRDTNFEIPEIFFVLPTGHPHKRLTSHTTPMDLYVDAWRDFREESRNPPVMAYIYNRKENCPFQLPTPNGPHILKDIFQKNDFKLENWFAKCLVLEIHYLLNTENNLVRMVLCWFNEYALFLEHIILEYQDIIKSLERRKDKLCGAIEQFETLLTAAKMQQKLTDSPDWEYKWKKWRYTETIASVERIVFHYESTLRSVRLDVIRKSQDIYDKVMKNDIFNLKRFQKKNGRNTTITCSELQNIVLEFSKARADFITDENIKYLHNILKSTHLRFISVMKAVQKAEEDLTSLQEDLLHFQLDILPSQQQRIFQPNGLTTDGQSFVVDKAAFDSIGSSSTEMLISTSMSICRIVEDDMAVDLK